MKLTKDNFRVRSNYGDEKNELIIYVEGFDKMYEIRDQILKNQEDASIINRYVAKICLQEAKKEHEIVEGLKKFDLHKIIHCADLLDSKLVYHKEDREFTESIRNFVKELQKTLVVIV